MHHSLVNSFRSTSFQEDKEPFLGPFILEMFATLLKKTVASVGGYGHPIGGLAMAVATVHLCLPPRFCSLTLFFQLERAFELIKQGLVTLDDEDDTDKKKPSLPQFNDKLWGPKVRKWVMSTQKLDIKKHWPNVLQRAASRVADFNIDEDGDEDGGDEDPRAMIVICKLSHF